MNNRLWYITNTQVSMFQCFQWSVINQYTLRRQQQPLINSWWRGVSSAERCIFVRWSGEVSHLGRRVWSVIKVWPWVWLFVELSGHQKKRCLGPTLTRYLLLLILSYTTVPNLHAQICISGHSETHMDSSSHSFVFLSLFQSTLLCPHHSALSMYWCYYPQVFWDHFDGETAL